MPGFVSVCVQGEVCFVFCVCVCVWRFLFFVCFFVSPVPSCEKRK